MGRVLVILTLVTLFMWLALTNPLLQNAQAFIPSVTSTGKQLRWDLPIHLNLIGNPTNRSNLSEKSFFNAVVSSLRQWQKASGQVFSFDYWQGSDRKLYPTKVALDGVSTIFFASAAPEPIPQISPNVLGLTQVWYDNESGQIQEVDIILNDINFIFTDDPTDTSGYGSEQSTASRYRTHVFVQNVITHELGHVQGLSHSGGLQSSMLFMESPEQAYLGCDELAAALTIYSPRESQEKLGSVSGRISFQDGSPVYGAHVLAISQVRGTVLATALTDSKGKYAVRGLEPGNYYLMAEPFYAGPSALSTYFADINVKVCPGETPFNRKFLTQDDSHVLTQLSVSPNHSTTAPPLVVQCRPADETLASVPNSSILKRGIVPEIHLNPNQQQNFGIVEQLDFTEEQVFKISGVSGNLQIYVLAYSIYSPIRASLVLYDSEGLEVRLRKLDPSYTGDSGFINYDSSIEANDLPDGTYFLKISSTRLRPYQYPAGPIALDSTPYVVLLGTSTHASLSRPSLVSYFPENARCRLPDDSSPYQSPTSQPPSPSLKQSGSGIGFCSSSPSGGTSHALRSSNTYLRLANIFSWALPWLFIFGVALVRLVHKRSFALSRLRTTMGSAILKIWQECWQKLQFVYLGFLHFLYTLRHHITPHRQKLRKKAFS